MNSQNDSEAPGEQMTLFSAGASLNHANRTAQQERDLERTMNATYGRRCLEQFERFSHVGSWAKTFSDLLIGMEGWYSRRCKLTWKLKGTKSNRLYFQLRVSTLPTEGIEFGLLPTSQARDWKGAQGRGYKGEANDLPTLAMNGLLPTPNCMDVLPPKEGEAMERIANGARKGRTAPSNLREYVNPASWEAYQKMLPTPTAMEFKDSQLTPEQAKKLDKGGRVLRRLGTLDMLEDGKASQLNPRFVAEMMGFPPNWTELPFQSGGMNQSKPTETQ